MSMLFKRIKDWAVSITSFRTGDVIPVDGPSGTVKMPYSDLAKEVIKDSANNPAATEADLVAGSTLPIMTTNGPKSLPGNTITPKTYAQNVAHSIAPEFDPTRTSENPYKVGEPVMYIDGKVYAFNVDHYGPWDNSHVSALPIVEIINNNKNYLSVDTCFEGAGSTAVEKFINCYPSTRYVVKIDPTLWASPDGSFNKIGIYSVNDAGTVLATHYQKASGSTTTAIDSEITFATSASATRIRILFRGNVGEKVHCVVKNNVVGVSLATTAEPFSSTKANNPDTGYAYLEGEKVTNQDKLYEFIKNHSSGAWDASEVEEIKVLEYVDGYKNITRFSGKIYGKNTTLVKKSFPCYPSTRYCVKITPTLWSAPSGSYNKLSVLSSDYSGTTLATHYTKSSSATYYDTPCKDPIEFTTHASAKYITIEFRGSAGVSVDYVVENGSINDVKELRTGFRFNADYSLPLACARYGVASTASKDFLAVIVTDSHGNYASVQQAMFASKASLVAQCLVHCGDFVPTRIQFGVDVTEWKNMVSNAELASYFIMGNHEKGNYRCIKYTPTDEQLYNNFVKPIVSKGYLSASEYTANKCYYYRDFSATKTRLIVIDEFMVPLEYDETYWEPITYDSSLPNCEDNTAYSTNDKVNIEGFTANSFRAKSSFNTGAYYSEYQPNYKAARGYRYIDQTEAEWFLNTLYNTPSDYQVVVALHNPFSDSAVPDKTRKFCQQVNVPDNVTGASWSQNYMQTDFIAESLNAFANSLSLSLTISVKPDSNASYVSAYSVTKDFSARGSNGKVAVLVGGHIHRDIVWKHPTYTSLYQITPMCSSSLSADNQNCDIRIATQNITSDERFKNSLTCVSAASDRIALCKLGNMYTIDGTRRDIEVISPSN